MAMLNPGNKTNKHSFIYLLFILFICCDQQSDKKNMQYEKSISTIGIEEYNTIYKKACDSLWLWNKNDLQNYWIRYDQLYKLDSLLCFNTNKDRFIGSIHRYTIDSSPSDELLFILGEKINNQWYFFSGSTSIVLPRKLYQKNETTPLSYAKIHQIALKEVYRGYLTKDEKINESWFISHFQGPGWGKYPETLEDVEKLTRVDYEKRHLEKVKNNWHGVNKDSIQQLQKKDEVLP